MMLLFPNPKPADAPAVEAKPKEHWVLSYRSPGDGRRARRRPSGSAWSWSASLDGGVADARAARRADRGCWSRRRPCVYCAVVETRGSTPQKAGAAMLVFPDGTQAGTLGGGCVEAEVKRRALHGLNAAGRPEVLTFCLDDDYGWDDGLICGGRMTILADPLADGPARDPPPTTTADCTTSSDRGAGYTEAVVDRRRAGLPVGDRYLFDADRRPGRRTSPSGPPGKRSTAHLAAARDAAAAVARGRASRTCRRCRGSRCCSSAAGTSGRRWRSSRPRSASTSGCSTTATSTPAPSASRPRAAGSSATSAPTLPRPGPDADAVARSRVILTRGHNHDEEALYHLAGTACGYVGMIGSKRKIRLIFEDLIAKGIPPEALERVHAPLGYDIGSQTVPEIAVSIVAELIACRNLGAAQAARQSWKPRGGAVIVANPER